MHSGSRSGPKYFLAIALLFISLSRLAGAESVVATTPDIAQLAERFEPRAVEDRRWLHQHAELPLREHETQDWLRQTLSEIPGVKLIEGDWGTGVVAMLEGGLAGPTVAWRTDTDALPITEETDLPFACTRRDTLSGGRDTGVMHACGHDIHMTVAVGMLRILSEVRDQLPGQVLFIGQPAEEIGAGALQLLEAGLFGEGRRPKCALAIHVHPTIPYGKVGSRPGPSTANVDGFRLTVKGKGGHGAYPHKSVDPVSLAARMVLAFEGIVARQMDVNRPSVISVGSIHGGSKSNVIPDEVVLEATVRSHEEETRQELKERIERTVVGLAAAHGAPEPELEYYFGTAAGYNNPTLVAQCREVFRRVLGKENEIIYDPPMGGEDFSYYGKEVPGFQYRLGVGRPEREMTLHSPDFDPDERAIGLGIRLAAELVWDQLSRGEALE
jgi:hippurate hydrolase